MASVLSKAALALSLSTLLAACTSTPPLTLEKRTLIDGLLAISAKHSAVIDAELTKALHIDLTQFEKTCTPGPDQCFFLPRAIFPDASTTGSVPFITSIHAQKFPDYSNHVKGWIGQQIDISWDKNACLATDEFKDNTDMSYTYRPSHGINESVASIHWPAQFEFKRGGDRNTLSLDATCGFSTRILIYFSEPEL
jgi:hypothetical protein